MASFGIRICCFEAWLFVCCLFASLPATAAQYTVTATSLTMHAGDPVPPLIFKVSSYSGAYADLFAGQPKLTTPATSSSPPGKYPITITAGGMRTVRPGDSLRFVPGTMTLIPADGIGAQLDNNIAYPRGEFEGPMFPMIDVKANPIARLAGNCSTDDTQNLQALLAWGRDSRRAIVDVHGTEVTADNGISFIGLSGPVQINGMVATVHHVSDATHLTLTASLGSLKHATLRAGGNVVNTSSNGNLVTASGGPTFEGLAPKSVLLIDGVRYTVASVTDSTHLVTKEPLPEESHVRLYAGSPSAAWGRQLLQLYFPAGCYLVSNQLQVYGNYWTFTGDGPQASYIRLAPNSAAFNKDAKAYLFASSSVSYNQNFREMLSNIGFNVGPGNPQTEVVHWLANNLGGMRNVQIWCDDSNCLQGIGLEGAYAGPSLIKNVAIYGSHFGIQMSGQDEYFMTLENVTTEGQLETALSNKHFHFTMRHWLSVNAVPAVVSTGSYASMAFLDSQLIYNGTGAVAGMSNVPGGNLYGRNVKCAEYKPCEIDSGAGAAMRRETLPYEFWTGEAQTVFEDKRQAKSLNLPAAETPELKDPCTHSKCDWEQLGNDPASWAGTIEHSKSRSFFLPPGSYDATGNIPITVPATVEYLNFNNAQFSLAHSGTKLYLSVSGSAATPLIIDGCMYANCYITHTGSRAVVLKDSYVGYESAPGAGDVYVDDGIFTSYTAGNAGGDGPTFYSSQHVWARALNIETGRSTDLAFPKFTCDGAKIWIAGYKTEQDSPSAVLRNGCEAEILGFFFYQMHMNPVPADASPIHVQDSSLFATGFVFLNKPGLGTSRWVNESQGAHTAAVPTLSPDAPQQLNMFYTFGAQRAPARGSTK